MCGQLCRKCRLLDLSSRSKVIFTCLCVCVRTFLGLRSGRPLRAEGARRLNKALSTLVILPLAEDGLEAFELVFEGHGWDGRSGSPAESGGTLKKVPRDRRDLGIVIGIVIVPSHLWVPFGLQCLSAAAAAMPSPSKVAPRTDDDIMDEEAGRARIRLAEESKARKKAQAALLKKQNTANLDKLKNQAAREDDDMTDEAAWKARAQLAAQSKARREAEQAAMKQREKEYKAKMASIVVRSDDDIMDEEAGKARIALAAESKAKKKAEKERLKAENKAYFDLIKNVKPRTDDDLLDDAQVRFVPPPICFVSCSLPGSDCSVRSLHIKWAYCNRACVPWGS